MGGKKKKKGKKGKKKQQLFDDDDSDDDLDPLKNAPAQKQESEEEDDDDDDEEDVPAKSGGASGFAALMGGDDEDEDEDEDDEDTDDDSDSEDGGSFFSVPLVTGKVLSTEDHPKADKLKVCEIDAGDRTYQIVTSAKNVKKGRRVALARPGCVVPQSGVRIEKSDMRGVESEGMVLSTYDLNWEDEKSKKV